GALDSFTLRVGRPIGPMLAQSAGSITDALERHGGAQFSRQVGWRPGSDPRTVMRSRLYRSLDDVTAACRRWFRQRWRCRSATLLPTARRLPCNQTAGRIASRSPHHDLAGR
ncbi:putative DNA ligase domain protein, partial [Mycobacterium ulcerans str. Harvey]